MDSILRQLVRNRAGDRCEYCHIHQDNDPFFRFHIEHIIARQHGGPTIESNLALACHHCNLHKGPNLTGMDTETGMPCLLFNPRTELWEDHFLQKGPHILGKTAIGRTTIHVLAINAIARLQLRAFVPT